MIKRRQEVFGDVVAIAALAATRDERYRDRIVGWAEELKGAAAASVANDSGSVSST